MQKTIFLTEIIPNFGEWQAVRLKTPHGAITLVADREALGNATRRHKGNTPQILFLRDEIEVVERAYRELGDGFASWLAQIIEIKIGYQDWLKTPVGKQIGEVPGQQQATLKGFCVAKEKTK